MAIDKCVTFIKPSNQSRMRMIGLTATSTDEMLLYESNYLTMLGFNLYDSKIEASFNDPPEAINMIDFFESTLRMARLIYIDEDKFKEVEALARRFDPNCVIWNNYPDLRVLRTLKSDTLLLVSDPILMRGFDYFCEESGIGLLICKRLNSSRDLKQALGRVQRYRSSSDRRFILEDLGTLEPVDHVAETSLITQC